MIPYVELLESRDCPSAVAPTPVYTVPNLLDGHATGMSITFNATGTHVVQDAAARPPIDPWRLTESQLRTYVGEMVEDGTHPASVAATAKLLPQLEAAYTAWFAAHGAAYNLEVFEAAAASESATGTVRLDVTGWLSHWLLPPPGVAAPTYGQAWTESLATAVAAFQQAQGQQI